MKNRQEICKKMRKLASQTLYDTLKKLLQSDKKISEVDLRKAWLDEMRKNTNIFLDGWYTPPPHGITILFATDTDISRVNFKNLREKEIWPRDDIFLNTKNGIAYLFACPVDKSTGVIGDYQTTIYFGNNAEIIELLKKCYALDKEIFEFAQVGKKLSEIALFADNLLEKNGMTNEVISITDSAVVNIGHTIPVPVQEWSIDERKQFEKGDSNWESIKNIISKKRIFTNTLQDYILKPGDALTIEPRPRVIAKPHLPTSLAYHTIGIFKENGDKELLTDFDDIFLLARMNYMLN